jgi:Zn-dependent protease
LGWRVVLLLVVVGSVVMEVSMAVPSPVRAWIAVRVPEVRVRVNVYLFGVVVEVVVVVSWVAIGMKGGLLTSLG